MVAAVWLFTIIFSWQLVPVASELHVLLAGSLPFAIAALWLWTARRIGTRHARQDDEADHQCAGHYLVW